MPHQHLSRIFEACADATGEAILNALIAAQDMEGRDGIVAHSLGADRLGSILRTHRSWYCASPLPGSRWCSCTYGGAGFVVWNDAQSPGTGFNESIRSYDPEDSHVATQKIGRWIDRDQEGARVPETRCGRGCVAWHGAGKLEESEGIVR
ncbi:hypothetical protein GTZ78_05010 [Streptomyces sp. SID8361]|nr:hypothetical protein [Streptomyces sp. SID8361]